MTNCLPENFREAKQRLLDHPEILRLFEEKHSIKKNTIIHAPVGMTEDSQVFFVLYAWDTEHFNPVGVVYYTSDLKQGVIHIKSRSRGAFLGTRMPDKDRDVIIANDPFVWLRVWQEGFADVWMIPEYTCIPSTISNWWQLVFIDFPESEKDKFVGMPVLSYNLESYNGEDLAAMTPEYVGMWALSSPGSVPFLANGLLNFLGHDSLNKKVLMDKYGNYPVKNLGQSMGYALHPKFGTVFTPVYGIRWTFGYTKSGSAPIVLWNKIMKYLRTKLCFLTNEQAATLTAFVMYQWVFPHCPTIINLQIYSSQYQWLAQIYNVVIPLVPRWSAYNKGAIPSVTWVEKVEEEQYVSRVPMIFLDLVETKKSKNFWFGLPLVISGNTGSKMENHKWSLLPKADWLRELLLEYAFNLNPTFPNIQPKHNFIAPLAMVVASVYKTYPVHLRTIADTFLDSSMRIRMDARNWTQLRDIINATVSWKNLPRSSKKSKTSANSIDTTQSESMPEKSPSDDEDGCS